MKVWTKDEHMFDGKILLVIPLLKNMNDATVGGGKGGGGGLGGSGGLGLGGSGGGSGGEYGGGGGGGIHVCVLNCTVVGAPPQGGDKPYRGSDVDPQILVASDNVKS